MSEDEHKTHSLNELTDAWKDLCERFFDKDLLDLTYNEIGVSYGESHGNIANSPLALSKGKKSNDAALAVQFIVPFFSKDAGT